MNILEIECVADAIPLFEPGRRIEFMRAAFMRLSSRLENSEWFTVLICSKPLLIFISVCLKRIFHSRRDGFRDAALIDWGEAIGIEW